MNAGRTAQGSVQFRDAEGVRANGAALAYVGFGYAGGIALISAAPWPWAALGVPLTAHAMLIAAYLLHDACHDAIFVRHEHNRVLGEILSFVAGGSYASFDRIRHLHLRHHRERADVTCFDYKAFLRRAPRGLTRAVLALEWAYLPAVELLMHAQLVLRPLLEPSERRHLPRVLGMLALRGAAFVLWAWLAPRGLVLYAVAYALLLGALNFFDAFHHSYDQYFVAADAPLPVERPSRDYEQRHTYSNLVSTTRDWPNWLTLNFGFHNAHHERMGAPWYRLPALHRELFGETRAVVPVRELLRTFHENRVRRVLADDYGTLGEGQGRADGFVGAHGVSFLTVV